MKVHYQTALPDLANRLRQLSERLTEEGTRVYQLYNIVIPPHWLPVFSTLAEGSGKTIAHIAKETGQPEASVSRIITDMTRDGFTENRSSENKGSESLIILSDTGKKIKSGVQDLYADVNAAIENARMETDHNLWKALEEWEQLLERKSLWQRILEQRKQRESQKVQIVEYTDAYHPHFKALNEEWIATYFTMEPADYKALDHPREYILNKGGRIFVALYEGEPVGVCALIRKDDSTFELAKMAVSPKAQGKSIGYLLGRHAIQKAREMGAKKVYLESNTLLQPAINLYYKLGFQKITGLPSPYERVDIQMELDL